MASSLNRYSQWVFWLKIILPIVALAILSTLFLFARKVDDSVYGIATGEAMAHLRYLEYAGRATCTVRDGVAWYSA